MGWFLIVFCIVIVLYGIYELIFQHKNFGSILSTMALIVLAYGFMGFDLVRTKVPSSFRSFFEVVE